MKPQETQRKPTTNNRRYAYTKVLDNRKQPIRGLWRRNGSFYARLSVESEDGRHKVKWVPLLAESSAEATTELRKLLTERDEKR